MRRGWRRALVIAAMMASWMGGAACQAKPWGLWQAYCRSFIDGQGRVMDHQRGDLTTSEGQAYAMFFALVADDRAHFDQLVSWTQNNLAGGDLARHEAGWEWGRAQDGEWKLLDAHPAADADLWMSYTLTEAGRLWHEPRYTAMGRAMAERIAREEVANLPGFGPMLLPGTEGFHPEADVWLLNPSYLPMPVMKRIAVVDPRGPWAAIVRKLPLFLQASSPHGFAMDWVQYSAGRGFQAAALPGEDGKPQGAPRGSYDAIRVYLWAGMSSRSDPESRRVLAAVNGLAKWLKAHSFPPEVVSESGEPSRQVGPVGFSAAAVPYLSALGEREAMQKQQERLAGTVSGTTQLYGNPATYYDQNLAMFEEGWETHRFRFDGDGELRVTWKN